jgi:hypothetical protein
MATISNTPRPGYVWDSADNVWYPIGVGAHQHTNAADTPAVMPYSTYAAAGKNKILNGDFGIWQRGTTFTNPTFSADRFQSSATNTGATVTRETFTPGGAPVAGYESEFFWRLTQTSAGTDPRIFTHLEDVRLFAGQTMTFSFWAKSDVASAISFIEVRQNFGSGGSTAVNTVLAAVGAVTVTSNWVRYTYTASIPSITGKTIGAGSYLRLSIYGVASTAFVLDTWGWQAEAGSNATAFQTATGNPQAELAACQRYYWRSAGGSTYTVSGFGFCNTSATAYIGVNLPVAMRTAPASVDFSAQNLNDAAANYSVTGLSLTSTWKATTMVMLEATVASGLTTNRPIFLTNNNNAAGYVGLSAEL